MQSISITLEAVELPDGSSVQLEYGSNGQSRDEAERTALEAWLKTEDGQRFTEATRAALQ